MHCCINHRYKRFRYSHSLPQLSFPSLSVSGRSVGFCAGQARSARQWQVNLGSRGARQGRARVGDDPGKLRHVHLLRASIDHSFSSFDASIHRRRGRSFHSLDMAPNPSQETVLITG